MEVDEEDFEQPSSSDNKASKKRFEVKKVKWQKLFLSANFVTRFDFICFLRMFFFARINYSAAIFSNE